MKVSIETLRARFITQKPNTDMGAEVNDCHATMSSKQKAAVRTDCYWVILRQLNQAFPPLIFNLVLFLLFLVKGEYVM